MVEKKGEKSARKGQVRIEGNRRTRRKIEEKEEDTKGTSVASMQRNKLKYTVFSRGGVFT